MLENYAKSDQTATVDGCEKDLELRKALVIDGMAVVQKLMAVREYKTCKDFAKAMSRASITKDVAMSKSV